MTEVVAALIWNGNKFLVCQRPAYKARGLLWEFVGGKVEQGETKEAALIRECREELGITVTVGAVFMEEEGLLVERAADGVKAAQTHLQYSKILLKVYFAQSVLGLNQELFFCALFLID